MGLIFGFAIIMVISAFALMNVKKQRQVQAQEQKKQRQLAQQQAQVEKEQREQRERQLEREQQEREEARQKAQRERQERDQEEQRQRLLAEQEAQYMEPLETSSGPVRVNFNFNFFFEDVLKAIIVVFDDEKDWYDYKLIRDSKQYTWVVIQKIQNNKEAMEKQVGLSERVPVYLMPLYSKANHEDLNKISEKILANQEQELSQALIKLDNKGNLVGGEAVDLFHRTRETAADAILTEVPQFMEKINYFVKEVGIVAYFKNETIASQVLEELSDSLQRAAHFCRVMQAVKIEIERKLQVTEPTFFMLIPSAARDDDFALLLMSYMVRDEVDPLSKYLIVIDGQGTVCEGMLKRSLPPEMLQDIGYELGDKELDDTVAPQAVNTTEPVRAISKDNDTVQGTYGVYEWFIEETGEIFYVGLGTGGQPALDKNDLFRQVYDKYPAGYRYVARHLTLEEGVQAKADTMKRVLELGNVLTNVQVPMGYPGGRSSAAKERTSYGARQFSYLKTPEVVGNIVEAHYDLLDGSEVYDDIDLTSLKKTVVPTYTLVNEAPLYFKNGSGNTAALVDILKDEIQERTAGKIYKSLAKSAHSVILTNDPFPNRVRELHDKGYKVFHMIDVIKFLKIDMEQIATDLTEQN